MLTEYLIPEKLHYIFEIIKSNPFIYFSIFFRLCDQGFKNLHQVLLPIYFRVFESFPRLVFDLRWDKRFSIDQFYFPRIIQFTPEELSALDVESVDGPSKKVIDFTEDFLNIELMVYTLPFYIEVCDFFTLLLFVIKLAY